ncbi:MAG: zinc dependent phospholipase C family protein [Spirochaetaceae bacterium]
MPSHFAHLLHSEDSVARAFPDLAAPAERLRSFLILGAQGPDQLYHNRRRKPSGLLYGSLSHRKNYGRAVAGMIRWAAGRGVPLRSEAGLFVLGYAAHAVLDRQLHPFINYFSDLPDTRVFPRAHAFFERIVDVLLLRRYRDTEPREIDFRALVDCGPNLPGEIEAMMTAGFLAAFDRADGDEDLPKRLQNAYLDSMGFYGYTNMVDEAAMRRAVAHADTERHERALIALLHPPHLPAGYDFANASHAEWRHPCDENERRTDSLYDLYEGAVSRAARVLTAVEAGWAARVPLFDAEAHVSEPSVEAVVGNHNLSDERLLPCSRICASPFPLVEIVDELRTAYQGRK